MTLSAALVLFAVTWFLTLFIMLPLNIKTQNDVGNVAQGTPPSAPTDPKIKRKLFLTTIIATVIWVPVCLIIIFEVITISDINFYNKLRG